jgi:hypothetical protein
VLVISFIIAFLFLIGWWHEKQREKYFIKLLNERLRREK